MPGPHYFAWTDPDTPWSTDLLREDEQIVSVELDQSEGQFAGLKLTVKNPGIGLLAPGRQVWGWYSWDAGGGDWIPILFGRLVAIPGNLHGETIVLEFIAKPTDFAEQKAALAASMRVLPYWDPVWISDVDAATSDDTVLETRAQLWHTDRVTLEVSASDIIAGEAGLIEITESEHLYADTSVELGSAPKVAVDIIGTVQFSQKGNGTIDLTRRLGNEYGIIVTPTGDGLMSSWPKPGTAISGGWSWNLATFAISATKRGTAQGELTPGSWFFPSAGHEFGSAGWKSAAFVRLPWVDPPSEKPVVPQVEIKIVDAGQEGQAGITLLSPKYVDVPITEVKINAILDWKADRKRTERVRCTLTADVQAVMTDPAGSDRDRIELTAPVSVDQPIDFDGAVPMGDTRRQSYLQQPRGQQSFEYLLLLGVSKLLAGARCVLITFKTSWAIGLGITCQHSVRLLDRRLPAGVAIGKVTAYALRASDGEETATITIGCTVGHGNTVEGMEGQNTYSHDYDVPGTYERRAGRQVELIPGTVTYEPLDSFTIEDDGINLLDFHDDQAVIAAYVIPAHMPSSSASFLAAQGLGPNAINGFNRPTVNPIDTIANNPTKIHIELKPVAGMEFVTVLEPTLSVLMIPKTIDLEAPSA